MNSRPPPITADHLRDPHRDRSAAFRQLDQAHVLHMLFDRDEVAAAYCQWLDGFLREQAKTAVPLRS
jgi:hypothetical protein